MKRRHFMKTAAGVAAPLLIPRHVLSAPGQPGASDRICLGAIGIGSRGSYDLGCFLQEPDARFVAVCDVRADRREAAKRRVDTKYGNQDCATYRDLRELLARSDIDAVLIATGPSWHGSASILAANAGKDVYCEKPCTRSIAQSLTLAATFRRTARIFQAGTQRRNLPNFVFAVELARRGKLGKLQTMHAHPMGLTTASSGWLPAEPDPPQEQLDWDLHLGPAAWRPYNRGCLQSFNFEEGGGMVGAGVLPWGSHTVDLCQWANDADHTAPVEYEPGLGKALARYANGVELVMRHDGWLPLGSCPVRFEGDKGWVETGDSGKLVLSSPELLAGRKIAEIGGYPATFHIREFLDCVKSRATPRANADVACQTHIACHAANISLFLNRKIQYDPVKNEFVNDEQANRLRGEALREPWRG